MEDHWQRQLRAIEARTQFFKQSDGRAARDLHNRLGSSSSRSASTTFRGASTYKSSYRPQQTPLQSSSRRNSSSYNPYMSKFGTSSSSSALSSTARLGLGLSPQNQRRAVHIDQIGRRVQGPTVEDAMHEFSKRTTDIMKVMHTVGSELAQVQQALGTTQNNNAGNNGNNRLLSSTTNENTATTNNTAVVPSSMVSRTFNPNVAALLDEASLTNEMNHIENIQHCVLQVGNLIDLLIKTLGVGQLEQLNLFTKVSNANKSISQILDSTKAIKGGIESTSISHATLKEAISKTQLEYDKAQRTLNAVQAELTTQKELNEAEAEERSNQTRNVEQHAHQQITRVSEDAEEKVQLLSAELTQYQTHLQDVNARCRQLQLQLDTSDNTSTHQLERVSAELRSAQSSVNRLQQELDACRDAELQHTEAKTTLQHNLMTEISSILRDVAQKKLKTADELRAKDRVIAQLETAEQVTARQTLKEAESLKQSYQSELRLLREELAAAKHAHEVSLLRLEYSSQSHGSSAEATANKKIMQLEHQTAQLEAEMAQYKVQARTAAELLKEHREADPIEELQATKTQLQEATHKAQLEVETGSVRNCVISSPPNSPSKPRMPTWAKSSSRRSRPT